MVRVVEIAAFLRDQGFTSPWAQQIGRSILESVALTRPGKSAIAETKLPHARQALERLSLRTCGDPACAVIARERAAGRLVVELEGASCDICLGSNNRRAAILLARACAASGTTRIAVLGGTAVNHRELRQLMEARGVSLRCVNAAENPPSKKEALADLAWAQVLAIWASTPLPHKVSALYTEDRPPGLRTITVARRGIEALCSELRRAVGRPP